MICLEFHCCYVIRCGGIRFRVSVGEGLCLCHWIFTGAAEVKILSLSSSLFIRLNLRAPPQATGKTGIKVLIIEKFICSEV